MAKLKITINYQVPSEHLEWHQYLMKSVAPIPFCDGELISSPSSRGNSAVSKAYMWMLASLTDDDKKDTRLYPLTTLFPYHRQRVIIRQPKGLNEREKFAQVFLNQLRQISTGLAIRLNRDMANLIYQYVQNNPQTYQTNIKTLLGFQKEVSDQLADVLYEEIVRRNTIRKIIEKNGGSLS